MNPFHLSADDSKVVKGVAVLLLLWHHLFYLHPEYGRFVHWTALQAKVCVAIFVFLSGYGLAKVFQPEQNVFLFYRKRLWKLYSTYWLIFLLCVPVSMLFFGVSIETAFPDVRYPWMGFIAQFFGMHMFYGGLGFNPTWWFMSAIIPLYILFPFICQAIDKYTWWALLACLICTTFPRVNIPILQPWIFPFTMGIFLAKWNPPKDSLLKKILSPVPKLITVLAVLVIFSFLQQQYGGRLNLINHFLRLNILKALFIIYASVYIALKIKALQKILSFLGEHSFNIFLTHTFIFYIWFPEYIYACKYPVLIMLALTVSSLIFSMLLNKIHVLLTLAYKISKQNIVPA